MKKFLILALPFGSILLLAWWVWSKYSSQAAASAANAGVLAPTQPATTPAASILAPTQPVVASPTPAGGTDPTGQFST
jgi:hypothetical protein